jgi:hypothetical protein
MKTEIGQLNSLTPKRFEMNGFYFHGLSNPSCDE